MSSAIKGHLAFLYGEASAPAVYAELQRRLQQWRHAQGVTSPSTPAQQSRQLTARDAVLITYADTVHDASEPPLRTLTAFLEGHTAGLLNTVHLLPFYPYSSDDGFSVIDYRAVDPALGSWADIARLGTRFRLMFDAVINHISAESSWFQAFLRDEAPYRDYFKVVAPGTDVSSVFRPRALPLLTPFSTARGEKLVWTTFSKDQIDLNYENPAVLLEVIDTILFYVAQGADLLRLDAIAFLWKGAGTRSLHLPQTHRVIQLLRAVLDEVAPAVILVTETNVPHEENISYFGDGHDEAHLVYNFPLPPLVLYSLHTGSAAALSTWARTLATPSDETAFFNFLASHDGIGVTPLRGILGDEVVDALAQRVEALGGFVSYKNNPDGSQSAYELNVNYLDALGDPAAAHEDDELVARRFLTAQAIMLALQGVPGIYFHSLFGSRGWRAGVDETGRYRTINREKLARDRLEQELAAPGSLRALVFEGYRRLLAARAQTDAFHPQAPQQVLAVDDALFAVQRSSRDGRAHVLCLHNVANRPVPVTLPVAQLAAAGTFRDLLSGAKFVTRGETLALTLAPFQTVWLAAEA